jgi:hypothetical protein
MALNQLGWTGAAFEGSHRAVHPVVLAGILQETLIDGTQVDDERVVHLGPSDSLRRSITKPD